MLTNRTLARINNRPRKIGRVPLLIVGSGTVVLAALLYVFGGLPSLAILAFLGGGILQKDNIEIPVVLYGLLQISTPVEDAKQAKEQVKKQRDELEKELRKGE
jgi:hypothetical protein